jgi:beta-phosphoglucomutase-like phosphatase (HAD superfamily)
MRLFVGKAVKDERAIIEARTGRPLTDAWLAQFRERRNQRLEAQLTPIAGAPEAVAQVHAAVQGPHRLRQRRGSLQGRTATGQVRPDAVLRGPHLQRPRDAAVQAGAGRVPRRGRRPGRGSGRCLVVEDTVTGVTAGVAAGATVFGYSPPEAGHDAPAALRAAGATTIFTAMRELPGLLA